MPIIFNIKPKVIQGGTLSSVSSNKYYSSFKTYNQYSEGLKYEDVELRLFFSYEEIDDPEKDYITIIFSGISKFQFIVSPVTTGIPFPVKYSLKNNEHTEIKNIQFMSGTGVSMNEIIPGYNFSKFSFTVPRDKSTININKFISRFDDIGVIESGNNYIELWITAVGYEESDNIKPWSIRKSNIFKTLNIPVGWFKVRNSNTWNDVSYNKSSDVNLVNKGHSRIRKSGNWRGQNKFGS